MIEFHSRALEELRDAQLWYRGRSAQAAARFVEAVAKALARIAENPGAQAVILPRFHYVRVSRFPFILVYQLQEMDRVFVIAAAHTSRRPGYWRRRQ